MAVVLVKALPALRPVMYVQAGAGVVADSVPEREQAECVDKARALFKAADEAVRFAARAKRAQ